MRRRIAQFSLVAVTAAIILGLYTLHSAVFARVQYNVWDSRRAVAGGAFLVLLLFTAYLNGLPDAVRRTRTAVAASFAAPAVAVVLVSIVQFAVGDARLPRFVVFASLLAVPLGNLAVTLPLVAANALSGIRTVILVNRDQRDELVGHLARVEPNRLIVTDLMVADDGWDGRRLMDMSADTPDRPEMVVVAEDLIRRDDITDALSRLHSGGVRVRTLLAFYEEWFRMVPLSELEDVSLLFDVSELHSPFYMRVKRLVDIGAALVLLIGLVLVLPLVALGNLVGNRGALVFRQPRVGKGGEVFDILKLRTMNTGSTGSDTWTEQRDPRVTPFGAVMRRLHIDELPQAVNILRGELSVVGPRPEQPQYVASLRESIPYYDVRHIVKPGLTGWAQIALGYTADRAGAQQKLQYELYYIRNQTIGFDLRLIVQTVRSALRRGGR